MENNFRYENVFSSRISELKINVGAANSEIRSIEIDGATYINADGIIFERNYLKANGLIIDKCKNSIFQKNFITKTYNTMVLNITTHAQNIIVVNNFFESNGLQTFASGTGSCSFINNIFIGNVLFFGGGIFLNNIINGGLYLAQVNIDARGNICSDASLSTYPGNLSNINFSILFKNNNSPDGKWQLADGSIAKGAGVNGVDCGMFGGDEKYVLSGIPPIPTIYEAIVPSTATNKDGLPVQLKAKTNK